MPQRTAFNEDGPSDGEAYCKIRYYQFQHDTKSEARWKACLRGSRLKNLNQLLRDKELTAGFDALLDIPGVWDGMRLTTLPRVMAMGCKDECLNYLRRIKEVLTDLVGKDALGKVDTATVKALELRAPGASTNDRNKCGKIFSAFSDRERDKIRDRLQMVDGLVPSLFTFFRDINYLKLCIDCLKRLVIVPKGASVCESLALICLGKNQREGHVRIQVTEDSFVHRTGNPADRVDLGVRQLVALAMRSYPDMPPDPIIEDPVQKATTKADRAVLRRLADLAYELGFESPQILSMKQYPYSKTRRESPQTPPLLVTSGNGVDLRHRSGIPRTAAFEEDRDSLYIDYLHSQEQVQGEGITSFFIRKSVYLAFFGRPLSTNGRSASRSLTGSPSRNMGGSAGGSSPHESGDIDDIVSFYDHDRQSQYSADTAEEDVGLASTDVVFHGSEEGEWLEEQRLAQGKVLINFIIRERGVWRYLPQIGVHPGNPAEVERVAKKYMRERIRTFNTRLRMLAPQECFQAVKDDRTQTILLVAQDDLNFDDEAMESASKLHTASLEKISRIRQI
ncbi:hypothetical protein VE00_07893 [Pseudogymnoascus sp. WSF 3629]|nr:hypothetical protein VE00_07893 [Pseudogymnoascus sp. WSF 3629]